MFAPEAGKPLYRVPAAGGVPTPVTKLAGSFAHAFPQFLPDGERVLYLDISGREKATSLYVGSLDGKPPVALPINGLGATYAPLGAASRIGYLFFLRASTLVAEAFDPDGLLPSSETAPLAGLPGTADFGYLPPFSVSKRRNWTRALRICHSLSTPRTDHSEVGSTIPLTLPGWVEPEEPLWRRVRPVGAGRVGRNRPRPALPPYAP